MTRFASLRSLALVLGVALTLAACDASIEPDDANAPDLTDAEVTEATQIVADALAEDGGGLFASARDLTSSVTDEGLADGPRSVPGHRDGRARCRGGEYSLTYNAETGTHVVAYTCSVETDRVQKSYASRLSYQYRDADGGFIPRPAANWDTVDSVAFGGTREGSVLINRGEFSSESVFEQVGRWTLSDLTSEGPAILSGRQQRSGTHARTGPGGSGSRTFSVDLSGQGIEIRAGDDGMGYMAVGELAYVLTMEVERNGQTRTRTVEGTIELEANGRALFRIIGLRGVYRVSLGDGATVLNP
ncbi:MAG: hypothetical protein ABJF88_08785 [Rhodothermales bacterium]